MRNTKQAFTLVELIVVITILAILGTIAFISLQGYSADARNSKRTSDLGNFQSAMSLKQVEWVPLLSFINSQVANTVTTSATVNLAGNTSALASTVYTAGTPNYTVLNVVAKDFKDPKSDKEYKIGATTLAGWVFQAAATLEVDWAPKSVVVGTYAPRNNSAVTWTPDSTSTTFTLSDANANRFKVNDKVNLTGGTATGATVTKVSRDGVTLTLSTSAWTNTSIALTWSGEMAGLINGVLANGSAGSIITNNDGTNFPY